MAIDRDVPFHLAKKVEDALESGERALWIGRPSEKLAASRSRWQMYLGLAILFVSLDAVSVAMMMPELPHRVAVAPFLIAGFWCASAPIRAAAKARATLYAVTDRRALIIEGGFRTSVRSFSAGDIGRPDRVERGHGAGDIYFEGAPRADFGRFWRRQRDGFFDLADACSVEEHLLAVAAPPRTPS